jgi:hypothetical protein
VKTCVPGWSFSVATFSLLWFLFKAFLLSSSLYILEIYYLRPSHEILYFPSILPPYLAKAYGLIFIINLILSAVVFAWLQSCIIQARWTSIQETKKHDDERIDTDYSRYSEPSSTRYAICLQRISQQAYEAYPHFALMSLIGGLKYPLAVAGGGVLWNLILVYKTVEVMILFRVEERYSNAFQEIRMSTGTWGIVAVEAIFAILTTAHMMEYI